MTEFFKGTVTRKDWAVTGGIVAAAALLAVVFYFLIHSPQTMRLQEVEVQLSQVKEQLKTAQDKERDNDALEAETAKMDELVTQFEKRLPDTAEIPMLLKDFEAFAKEIGMRVELAMLPRVPDETKGKEEIPYSVAAWGDFHQIVSFINRLERFQRYLRVSDLRISEEKDGVAEASFTLTTFRFIKQDEETSS